MSAETLRVRYRARCQTGSRLELETDLPIDLNQMVVWIMLHQDPARDLLPEYRRMRELEDPAQK